MRVLDCPSNVSPVMLGVPISQRTQDFIYVTVSCNESIFPSKDHSVLNNS